VKPIFTIHAGEYLVGSYIEGNFKNYNVWIPSKDTGVDLLITNKTNTKTVSLQVKFSKDFLTTHFTDYFQQRLLACGWWTINEEKLSRSKADFWVLVLYSHSHKNVQHIVIKPAELLSRYHALNRKGKSIQSYLQVTKKHRCWESRELGKEDQKLIAEGKYSDATRDFSKYLNSWGQIKL
jgi:hypothetical protein